MFQEFVLGRDKFGTKFRIITTFVSSFKSWTRWIKEVITGKYAGVPVEQLFFQPFKRIFVQQLTVILGGFFILFGGTQPYLIILVLINLAADLFFFFIENAKLKAMMTHGDPEAEKKFDDMKRMMKYWTTQFFVLQFFLSWKHH